MRNGKEAGGQSSPPRRRHHDAEFLGWQRTSWGEEFPLYNITAIGHPSMGSTVTGASLLRLHLQVPRTPLRPARKA